MAKKKTEYSLGVSFPFGENYQTIEKKIEKLIGIEVGGSGAGFGQRDLSFYSFDKKQLEDAVVKLKKSRIKGLEIYKINKYSYQE